MGDRELPEVIAGWKRKRAEDRKGGGQMSERKNILRVEHVTMQFGGVVAVNDLSLEVNEGEIVALIGPNGAGKTTAFNVITGVYQPTNGRVAFRDETIIRNYPQGKMSKTLQGQARRYVYRRVRPGGSPCGRDPRCLAGGGARPGSSRLHLSRPGPHAGRDHKAGHGPDLPEHPALEVPDGL